MKKGFREIYRNWRARFPNIFPTGARAKVVENTRPASSWTQTVVSAADSGWNQEGWKEGKSGRCELTSGVILGSSDLESLLRLRSFREWWLRARAERGSNGDKDFMTSENKFGDHIHIEQLEVFARIGVPDDERSQPQRLTLNITFWPARQGAELGDDINRAVDYATVCAETKKFIQARADRLIESLADALAVHLLGLFEIQRIAIELRKFILPDTQFISVTVTRDRTAK